MSSRTAQQEKDFGFINHLWGIFRDFGDLTMDKSDAAKWKALFDREEEILKQYDQKEHRRALALAFLILECRAKNDYKWLEDRANVYYVVHGTEELKRLKEMV